MSTYENKGTTSVTSIVSQDPDRSGNYVGTDPATCMTALQQAVADLPDDGGVIVLKSPFKANGTLTITQSNITIKSDLAVPPADGICQIQLLVINSAAADVEQVRFEGIYFRMVTFNSSGGHSIEDIYFDDCRVNANASAASEGIVWTGSAQIHDIYFNRCKFRDVGQSARSGFCSFNNYNQGNGQYYFDHCTYTTGGGGRDYVFLAFEDEGFVGPAIYVNHLNCVLDAGANSFTFVRLFDQTNVAARGGIHLMVSHGWFELHATTTFVRVDACTVACNNVKAHFEHNWISIVGGAHTYVNILNANWVGAGNEVAFWHNPANGAVTIGTPAEHANFELIVRDNDGLNPSIVNATPFIGTFIAISGTGASPAASTDYTIRHCDIVVEADDSGNNDVALVLKDPAGTAVWGTAVSPNAMAEGGNVFRFYAPRGYILNWGAFTGAAPTPTISFV